MAIFTDGLENASCRFTSRDIADRIKDQREKYGWEILFLGANQDAIATAARMNVGGAHASSMASSAAGFYGASLAASRKVRSLRSQSMGMVDADAAASMSQLVAEETRAAEGGKRKGKSSSSKSPHASNPEKAKTSR